MGPCIPDHFVCDEYLDCEETKTDEIGCPCPQEGDFRCSNLRCIAPDLMCNGADECGDNSDEMDCPTLETTTEPLTTLLATTEPQTTTEFAMTTESDPCDIGNFACSRDGPCIDEGLQCDSLIDCIETRADEMGCPCPVDTHVRCPNIRCIAPDLICDGEDDCGDNFDETNCPTTPTVEPTTAGVCDSDFFPCALNGSCIEDIYMCDAIIDCKESYADEIDCACPKEGDLRCPNARCIAPELFCNGMDECGDNSDEANCPTTASPTTSFLPSTAEVFMTTNSGLCDDGHFTCSPGGECMENIYICDEFVDCNETYEDERYCECKQEGYFRCDNLRCIAPDLICNDIDDCGDNSDERNCSCDAGEFSCSEYGPCIPGGFVCDDFVDCIETNADETNCESNFLFPE
ncbi:uncharacterized protein [Amphiura filiformis]|uniref:uncharacterized protein n=1 Tax=Amphiura filiformis TaxID=82378 RepID=UPI003B2203A6